ncbi:hypothetical protein B5M42_003765 [Paenibacillus athensensis]|uniref:Uncharacterized protein n=1 Tax=Paenibacillus athensensis TaxID=1967502 RepID=A0A4Y8PUT1_9BACL|nr:hypothetical protein [Paenibacillus athensensis]MCD1257959.1 hypothetical protein [Paenibacillus athensensis]
MNRAAAYPDPTRGKLDQLLHPGYPLCKEDVVWILEFIKKKVAEEDPQMQVTSQPHLIKNFLYFAEVAMMLIHRRNGFDQEADRLKKWLREAAYGRQDSPAG